MKSKHQLRQWIYIFHVLVLTSCYSCHNSNKDFYTPAEFYTVKKIDAHCHIWAADTLFIETGKKNNFGFITVNVELPNALSIESQEYFAFSLHRKFPVNLFSLTTFETNGINQPGWSNEQLIRLKKSFADGAIGIKVWKNIGMTIRGKDSAFIMIDDPVFDSIFNYLESNGIPVMGHIGEPKNCWLPLDQMTTINDKNYFKTHPEYHMYFHPEYPSYEALIQSRDHLLEKHPKMKFLAAHLASLEWDVDEIAKRLDKFPGMMVEPAERMGQLHFQSTTNWQKVHDFFIKYQDRIMYGTDIAVSGSFNPDTVKSKAQELWLRDWKYLASDNTLFSPFIEKEVKGLKLPKRVVTKIYFENAQRFFGIRD